MIRDYKPIDYREWVFGDKAREGVNIRRLGLLNSLELSVFDASTLHRDRREDPGHIETALYFSFSAAQGTKAKREIYVPAITLHDDGYEGFVSPEQFRDAIKTKEGESAVRLLHQVTVIKRSFETLRSLGYPGEYIAEILAIMSDHDTRFTEPISDNEKVLRDADILWRFTVPCTRAYKSEEPPEEVLRYMQKDELERSGRFHLPQSIGIARIEIANTICDLFPEQASRLLETDFSEELRKIKDFYS